MNTRMIAAMVGMGVVIGLLAGLLIGALLFRSAAEPVRPMAANQQTIEVTPPDLTGPVAERPVNVEADKVDVVVSGAEPPRARVEPALPRPDAKPLAQLADRICEGDANAVTELIVSAGKLYEGINFERDTQRVRDNFVVMTAAFERIGQAAGKSPAAMSALEECAVSGTHVSGFATNALGAAAAAGNTQALNMLLHYDQFGILQSSAVGALQRPASEGNAQAIEFLVRVMDDPTARPLWHMVSEGLAKPAALGNAAAAAAMQRFESQNQH